MDPVSVLYFRVSATTVASSSVLLNCLVLGLILFKTPKEYRNFSIVYGTFSALEIIGGTIGWTVIHENSPNFNGTSYVVSYGICAYGGGHLCYILDQFTFPTMEFLVFLCPISMGYRIYCFVFKPLSSKGVWLFLFVQAVPWIYFCYYRILWFVPPEVVAPLIPSSHQQYTTYGFTTADTWQWAFMDLMFFSPHFAGVSTLILRQILIYVINKQSQQISAHNYSVHRQFVWMLTVQGIVPLILAIGSTATFAVRFDKAAHPFLNALSYILFMIGPILDATVLVFCLTPYRRVVLGWMVCFTSKKQSKKQTIITINTSEIQ